MPEHQVGQVIRQETVENVVWQLNYTTNTIPKQQRMHYYIELFKPDSKLVERCEVSAQRLEILKHSTFTAKTDKIDLLF